MKNLKAYTLMEMLVVMSIMIILLALGFNAYSSFTETTKFNQDIANLQSDILILQRASMLLERKPSEYWVYGVGIDFGGIAEGTGEYTFFKWCSKFEDFGDSWTKGEYPRYVEGDSEANGDLGSYAGGTISQCDVDTGNKLLSLGGYGNHHLNLKERVSISSDIRFLLFESVSGRAFLYDVNGERIANPNNLEIIFNKNYGQSKTLTVKNLTGRTKITDTL